MSGAARRDQNESLQTLTREGNSLRKSEQLVDEMMRQGAETVHQLHEQKNTLKGAQRKMMVRCPPQRSHPLPPTEATTRGSQSATLLTNQNASLCTLAGRDEHAGSIELIDGCHRQETTDGSVVCLPWDADYAGLPLLALLVEISAISRHNQHAIGYRCGRIRW